MAAHAFVMKTFLRRARNAILRVIAKISQETGVFGNSCHALRLSCSSNLWRLMLLFGLNLMHFASSEGYGETVNA